MPDVFALMAAFHRDILDVLVSYNGIPLPTMSRALGVARSRGAMSRRTINQIRRTGLACSACRHITSTFFSDPREDAFSQLRSGATPFVQFEGVDSEDIEVIDCDEEEKHSDARNSLVVPQPWEPSMLQDDRKLRRRSKATAEVSLDAGPLGDC